MKKYIIFSGLMLYTFSVLGQGLLNNGAHIVVGAGAYCVTNGSDGNITNTTGLIDLTGTLKLTGNFINNATEAAAFGVLASGSEVIFSGSGAQLVDGASAVVFRFPKLSVSANSSVQIAAGKQVTLEGDLVNEGAFTLKSDADNGAATLLTNSGFSGAGQFNMEAYMTAGRNWYVSSPVTDAKSAVLNASTNPLYWYDEANGSTAPWVAITDNTTSLSPRAGYISTVAVDGVSTFTGGTYNNTNVIQTVNRTAGVAKEGFHLLGNPYPAYLDVESAVKTNMVPTFWYRSKNAGNTAYVFDTYNMASCEGISLSGKPVTKFIPPMQAFWVRASTSDTPGTISFDKKNCYHRDNFNNRRRVVAASDKKLLRLQVSNGTNYDETLLVFNSQASDAYDAFDSPKMSNGSVVIPEIYTKVGSEVLAINGMTAFSSDKVVALGFSTGQQNTFSIKAAELSGFDASVQVTLVDKQENAKYDLTDGRAYSFESGIANTVDRFEVIFKSSTTVTDNSALKSSDIHLARLDNQRMLITLTEASETEGLASVCNAAGVVLFSRPLHEMQTVLSLPFPPGVYVVKAASHGKTKIEKIIIE